MTKKKFIINCKSHGKIEIIVNCPACIGAITSKKKAISSAQNGLKGGRPTNKKKLQPLIDFLRNIESCEADGI